MGSLQALQHQPMISQWRRGEISQKGHAFFFSIPLNATKVDSSGLQGHFPLPKHPNNSMANRCKQAASSVAIQISVNGWLQGTVIYYSGLFREFPTYNPPSCQRFGAGEVFWDQRLGTSGKAGGLKDLNRSKRFEELRRS
jgi:hypothetical protein